MSFGIPIVYMRVLIASLNYDDSYKTSYYQFYGDNSNLNESRVKIKSNIRTIIV